MHDLSKKILENDKDIKNIVKNFQGKKNHKYNSLLEKFGEIPSENDVIWGLLHDLYFDSIHTDHRLLLNVEYQRGILLQKEKKYKDAISHYSYGLYYLLNTYNYPFNPNKHKYDIPEVEIYKAQEKFINKLAKCVNKGQITIDIFFKSVVYLIEDSELGTNVSLDIFLRAIMLHLNSEFYDIDLAEKIVFSEISTTDIKFYATKFRNLIKNLIKDKDEERIIKTLNKLYALGCFHEYLFGNYVSVGWTHELANEKKKNFNSKKCVYIGNKIIYKKNEEYHKQFIQEYKKIFNKELNYNFVNYTSDELLTHKDYKLLDKYLLGLI